MKKQPFTVCNPDGSQTEYPGDSQMAQAHRALSHAADRMGKSGYAAHKASRFGKRPFTPSAAHEEVVKAMPALLAGKITPEEAMALLHTYDVNKERLS